jgi:hypothetical protein
MNVVVVKGQTERWNQNTNKTQHSTKNKVQPEEGQQQAGRQGSPRNGGAGGGGTGWRLAPVSLRLCVHAGKSLHLLSAIGPVLTPHPRNDAMCSHVFPTEEASKNEKSGPWLQKKSSCYNYVALLINNECINNIIMNKLIIITTRLPHHRCVCRSE